MISKAEADFYADVLNDAASSLESTRFNISVIRPDTLTRPIILEISESADRPYDEVKILSNGRVQMTISHILRHLSNKLLSLHDNEEDVNDSAQ